jgi:hypothetical protein
MTTSPFNIILQVLESREEKEAKGIQIRKEGLKLPLFTADMTLYVKNKIHSSNHNNLEKQYTSPVKLQNTK